MPSEEIDGVVISSFPNAPIIENNDVVTGLHNGNNANFLFSGIAAYIRQGLSNIFVPWSRIGTPNGVASLDSTGKVPSTQLPSIPSDASDITYDSTTSGLSATNVQDAVDEMQGEIDNLPSPPAPSDANPQDLGTAAAGSSADYSRADHVHAKPSASDIGAQDKITASGILKGDGQGGVSAATAGTDYQAPLAAGTDYATPAQLDAKANQAQLATVETGSTASRAYAVGEYFCWNGLLYRVTAAISSGQPFNPGTNCEAVAGGLANSYGLDISNAITINNSRVKNATIKAYLYPNRKVEVSIVAEANVTLTSNQNTLFSISSLYYPASGLYYCGAGMVRLTTPVAVYVGNVSQLNVQHGGLSVGDKVSLNISWYI